MLLKLKKEKFYIKINHKRKKKQASVSSKGDRTDTYEIKGGGKESFTFFFVVVALLRTLIFVEVI